MVFCRNGCGTNLNFDESCKSDSGKMIPLEDDGSPHNCPNRHKYGPRTENGIEKKIEKMEKNLSKIMLDVQFIRMNWRDKKPLMRLDNQIHWTKSNTVGYLHY